MKKVIVLAAAGIMVLGSCGKSEVNQNGANVFPCSTKEDSISVTMGDVMPFYDNGVMNIYHLRNVSGTNSLFYHPIARLTTSDYIHYKDEGIALNYEESITSVDAALGTGSFIKDKEGNYHCFYTGHNDKAHDEENKGAGLKHTEVIRHAVSKDNQATWQKEEDFLLYGYEDDFRDPYVYFDEVDQKYYMLVTSRDYGNAVIRRFGATSLNAKWNEWEFVDNFFTNDEGSYNMECPSYIEWNGYYYLAYSEQGDNRVTHYRYKTSHDGEWKKFERDAIDSAGFYAGRIEKAGNEVYAFAWCARLTGGNTGAFDWAGNLVTHQLIQKENGELCAVMPHGYKEFFHHEMPAGENPTSFAFSGEKFEAVALDKLGDKVRRMSAKISVNGNTGDFGISFGLDAKLNNRLGSGILAFHLPSKRIACHNNVSNILRYGSELTGLNYEFQQGQTYGLDLIMDDEIFTVYMNGDIALTARLVDMKNNHLAFYSNHAKATISEVMFYE